MTTVRQYEPRDLNSCRRLWVELTEWHRDLYERPEIGGAEPEKGFDRHLARVGPECVWVADDGEVVGLAGLAVEGDHGEAEPVVVARAHRGRGIGTQLVAEVVAAARTRGLRQLVVRPVARNAPALGFFRERGFDAIGHVDLLLDLTPRRGGGWRRGERLAGYEFRV